MIANLITENESIKIGKSCREALDGNYLVCAFAAELVGESYPLSKSMCDIVFANYNDSDLGYKFIEWIRKEKL